MVKYAYDVVSEVFKREDNRGNHLAVNIAEANRIISLLNLGYSVAEITLKVPLSSPKGTTSTVNSFIKNYRAGNIEMPENAPAPTQNLQSITDSERIDALEERVTRLENLFVPVDCECEEYAEKSKIGKVREWLPF